MTSTGLPVCERCLVADTVGLRLRGLLGHRALPSGDGVWIHPSKAIHMFFMRFAIDAVFVDRDDAVVKITAGLKPWRMSFCGHASSVLELAAGEAGRRGLEVGDRLDRVEPDVLAHTA